MNMRTDDIYGTKPNVMKDTIKTNRVTNPMLPQYPVFKVEKPPVTPPKFIKDQLKIEVLSNVSNVF